MSRPLKADRPIEQMPAPHAMVFWCVEGDWQCQIAHAAVRAHGGAEGVMLALAEAYEEHQREAHGGQLPEALSKLEMSTGHKPTGGMLGQMLPRWYPAH